MSAGESSRACQEGTQLLEKEFPLGDEEYVNFFSCAQLNSGQCKIFLTEENQNLKLYLLGEGDTRHLFQRNAIINFCTTQNPKALVVCSLMTDFELILPEPSAPVLRYFNSEFFGETPPGINHKYTILTLPLLSRHVFLDHQEIVSHLVQNEGYKLTGDCFNLAINNHKIGDFGMLKTLLTLAKDRSQTEISGQEMDRIFATAFSPAASWEPISLFLELDFPLSADRFNQLIKRSYDLPNFKQQLLRRKEVVTCLLDIDWTSYPDPRLVQELIDHGADPAASRPASMIGGPIHALARAIKDTGYPRSTATSYFSILLRSGVSVPDGLIQTLIKDCKESRNRDNILLILNALIWDSQICQFFRQEISDPEFLAKILPSYPTCGDYNPYDHTFDTFFQKNPGSFTEEERDILDRLLNKLMSKRATCCVHTCRSGKYYFPRSNAERKIFRGANFCLWHYDLYIPDHIDIADRYLPRYTFSKPCAIEHNRFAFLTADILLDILKRVGPTNTHRIGSCCQSWYTFYHTVLPNPPKFRLTEHGYTPSHYSYRRVYKFDVPKDQSVGIYFRGETITKYSRIKVFPTRPDPGKRIAHTINTVSSLQATPEGSLLLESVQELYSFDSSHKHQAYFQYIWPVAINGYGMTRGAHSRTALL